MTDKLRIESFENWAVKQAEDISDLSMKVSSGLETTESALEDVQGRINQIESNIKNLKEIDMENESVEQNTVKPEVSLGCEHCDIKFRKAIDLESHMEEHNLVQKHNCEVCGKKFYLKWRLSKHMRSHEDSSARNCHYYNNQKDCPFFKVGCKFKHQKAGK